MTTNEIKTLIQNTIAGQGSQVDIGGKLAEILGAIVDTMQDYRKKVFFDVAHTVEQESTLEDVLAAFTINGEPATWEMIENLNLQEYDISARFASRHYELNLSFISKVDDMITFVFGGRFSEDFAAELIIILSSDPGNNQYIDFWEL